MAILAIMKNNINRGNEELKMIQVRISIPEKYRRLFKAYCTEIGTDMSKEITQLIESRLIKAGKLVVEVKENEGT